MYKWSTVVSVAVGETLYFDAEDNPDTVWIMQIAQGLNFMANSKVELKNGANSSNIFWQVAGVATILADAHAEGVILCATAITFGARGSLTGRGLAQTSVTMIANTVIHPPPWCFFVFSTDQSMLFKVAVQYAIDVFGYPASYPIENNPLYDSAAFETGLVGKIWDGVKLTITPYGVDGTPEPGSGAGVVLEPAIVSGVDTMGNVTAVVSDIFCLDRGIYEITTVRLQYPSQHPN